MVQNYFANLNVRLKYPTIICVKLRSPPGMTIVMPVELLELIPGQMLKGRVSPEIAAQMIKMTRAKPAERLQNTHEGFHVRQLPNFHPDIVHFIIFSLF